MLAVALMLILLTVPLYRGLRHRDLQNLSLCKLYWTFQETIYVRP